MIIVIMIIIISPRQHSPPSSASPRASSARGAPPCAWFCVYGSPRPALLLAPWFCVYGFCARRSSLRPGLLGSRRPCGCKWVSCYMAILRNHVIVTIMISSIISGSIAIIIIVIIIIQYNLEVQCIFRRHELSCAPAPGGRWTLRLLAGSMWTLRNSMYG